MCGIAGIIDIENIENFSFKNQILIKIINHQKNRGPDSSSIWSSEDEKFFIGFNWLAIQDNQDIANQPFFSENKQHALLFNGEIFNFKELKEKYYRNHIFKTSSDTEVLFLLLRDYGETIISELEGFFSIGFFDLKNNNFFLARDRFGIKPLYYLIQNRVLYFSSTFKELNQICFNNKFDLTSEVSFYLFGSIYGSKTTNKKIKQLEPGNIFRNNNREIKIYSYYSLVNKLYEDQYNSTSIEEIVDHLRYVVKKYSVSQADWSLMLSSGIDSNILKNLLNSETTTFTLLFNDRKIYSEKSLIKQTKNNIFFEVNCENEKKNIFNKYLNSMEQPTIDGFNTYLITYLIKRHNINNKVCLSGLGLDELLGGYKYKKKILISKFIFNFNKIFNNNFLNKYIKNMDPKKYLNNFDKDANFQNYLLFRLITPFEYLSKDYNFNELHQAYEELFTIMHDKINEIKVINNNNEFIFDLLNFEFYLKDQLLKDGDNMSMDNSIELRFPFLEHNFVEKIFNFRKFNKIDKKNLAAHFIKDKLILNKKKTGFSFPIPISINKNIPKYFNYQIEILSNFKKNIGI